MKDGRFFLDTNLFIYSIDDKDPDKYVRSLDLVVVAIRSEKGAISFQIVQEFINTSTSRFGYTNERAADYCKNFLFPLWEIYPSRDLYLQAIAIQERYRYSFYDSLIIAAAQEAKCKTLYSEDLQHQQKIEGLTIINPFA